MRVAFLLLICLVAGSQATFFDDLKETLHGVGTTLTTTIHAVGDQAKVVGTSLLQTAAEQGKQLASQALQSTIYLYFCLYFCILWFIFSSTINALHFFFSSKHDNQVS